MKRLPHSEVSVSFTFDDGLLDLGIIPPSLCLALASSTHPKLRPQSASSNISTPNAPFALTGRHHSTKPASSRQYDVFKAGPTCFCGCQANSTSNSNPNLRISHGRLQTACAIIRNRWNICKCSCESTRRPSLFPRSSWTVLAFPSPSIFSSIETFNPT